MPPLSGAISPVNCPISVVFPAPFGPISACSSPRGSANEIASEATTPPKRLLKVSISRSASATAGSAAEQSIDAAVDVDRHDQEQRTENEVRIIGDMRQTLLQEQESHGADQRAEHRMHA